MTYTEITLGSGRKIKVRPQTWPEFSGQMDAYLDALEAAAAAGETERDAALLAVRRLEWRALKDKLAACLEDPGAQQELSRDEAAELAAAIDRLGETELTRKNLSAGGDGAATPTGPATAATA